MARQLAFGDMWLPCLILLVLWARPTAAFGAGNIASMSKVEGQNWRHGDIEDTLLTLLISSRTGKKFSKMDVKRVYFGNWLRDYSQAVDVGTVKMVSAEAIRILLWVLGFLSFGYGTKEFEVTRDRLGCYRPEEHIDNPKDYADNLDARDYDRRLRGPVDERRELAVDERTGLKTYIASEDAGITTSAGMVRDLLHRCIDLGRRSGGRGEDFYEALRLLGTATHCLEDYSAHSNYTELCLIELGARDVFPHVGRNARVQIEGVRNPVYPIITGTFGGVDFLHSVCGEISDKATQSELQELEGAINDADRKQNKSAIKDLLSQLPSGIFGDKDQAGKADELEANAQAAKMENMHITPKEPEEFTQQLDALVKQIYPVMEFHDDIMHSIADFMENIPVLPELVEQLQEQVNIFVFSLLAPFVVPIITQVKTELETGSSEVIASSREKQHIVFSDDECTDPTHSMLSKDHFSNLLNEPAGRVASEVLKWAVPQVVACWDGEADPEQTINIIIQAVFHHPAQLRHQDRRVEEGRNVMFNTVRQWWESKGDGQRQLIRQLSREGVEQGLNHKDGPKDSGHGCCKPIGMTSDFSFGNKKGGNAGAQKIGDQAGKLASEAVGGGALGGLVGGLVGGIGGSLLGGAFGEDEKKSKKEKKYGDDGSYTQSYSESGHHKKSSRDDTERYGKASYEQTQYSDGGRREEYSRREQDTSGGSYGYDQRVETTSYGGTGGYERREERRYESGGQTRIEESREGFDRQGEYYHEEKKKTKKYGKESEDEESNDEDDYEKRAKKERKRREKEEKKNRKHGSDDERSGGDSYKRRSGEHKRGGSPKRHSGGYGGERREESGGYGRQEQSSYGGRQEQSGYGQSEYGRQEPSGYGRQEQSGYGQSGQSEYGRQEQSSYGGRQEQSSYGGRQEQSGYGQSEYGRQEQSGYGRQEQPSYGQSEYGRQEPSGYGRQESGYGNDSEAYGGRAPPPGGFGGGGEEEYGERRQQYGGGGGGGYEQESGNEYGRRY